MVHEIEVQHFSCPEMDFSHEIRHRLTKALNSILESAGTFDVRIATYAMRDDFDPVYDFEFYDQSSETPVIRWEGNGNRFSLSRSVVDGLRDSTQIELLVYAAHVLIDLLVKGKL